MLSGDYVVVFAMVVAVVAPAWDSFLFRRFLDGRISMFEGCRRRDVKRFDTYLP